MPHTNYMMIRFQLYQILNYFCFVLLVLILIGHFFFVHAKGVVQGLLLGRFFFIFHAKGVTNVDWILLFLEG